MQKCTHKKTCNPFDCMILYSGKVKKCIYNAKGGQEDAAIFEYCVKGH